MSTTNYKELFEKLDTYFEDKELKKTALALVKQVAKFAYFEEKHIEKVRKFADNDALIDVLLEKIKSIPYPLFEVSCAQSYTLTIFAMSHHKMAHEYLDEFVDLAIKEYSGSNICGVQAIILMTKNEMDSPLFEKINAYRKKAFQSTGVAEFAKEVGVSATADEDIYFSVTFTNFENVKYDFLLDNDEDKKKFASLSISVFYPKSEKHCFTIKLNTKSGYSFYHLYPEPIVSKREGIEIVYNYGEKKWFLEDGNNLCNLKNTIKEIEKITGLHFYKKFADTRFPKGVKGKASVQKWFLEE